MNRHFSDGYTKFIIALFLPIILSFYSSSEPLNVSITVHLRGVYNCKISLLGKSGSGVFTSITDVQGIRNGETTCILVSKELLPGEFVLRFDYKEKEESSPYPSEKYIFINEQDMEIWVNPMYANTSDSTWFQKDEKENSTFIRFSGENAGKKEKLALLQNLLLNYDDPGSDFYQEGIKEYEKRRLEYNHWLNESYQKDKELFISTLYQFEYIPYIPWSGNETDRINSLIAHYFDYMDFQNPLMVKLSNLNKWMDNYVNLYGQLSTTIALRDSLFPEAGRTAIEKARKGNPLVYGWMVDYFYRGFESNGITSGMKILEPYLNDPNCLTTKRIEINKRLEGIKTLLPGTKAPDFFLKDIEGNPFDLYSYTTPFKYLLLLFWSAGCSHCMETVDHLYPWQQQKEIQQKVAVIAVGLDETEKDIIKWKSSITELKSWKHLGEPRGVSSKVANDYYILSTPVMILLNANTKEIIALPNSINELISAIQ